MPPMKVIDMRNELRSGNISLFSRELFRDMQEKLSKGEQIILFLNRRGFSTFVSCRSCGYVFKCEECDISMTYHRSVQNVIVNMLSFLVQELKELRKR